MTRSGSGKREDANGSSTLQLSACQPTQRLQFCRVVVSNTACRGSANARACFHQMLPLPRRRACALSVSLFKERPCLDCDVSSLMTHTCGQTVGSPNTTRSLPWEANTAAGVANTQTGFRAPRASDTTTSRQAAARKQESNLGVQTRPLRPSKWPIKHPMKHL